MEAQLENLIEKLKTEGVQAARKQSDDITKVAKSDAQKIIDKAQNEANQIIDQAQQKAVKFKTSAEAAVKQASRDTALIMKEKIFGLFDRVLKAQVQRSLSPDFLRELIPKIIEQMHTKETVEVLAGDADREKLQQFLQAGLKKELKNEVEIKVSNRITKGFRIGVKDKNVYYDFTDESIVAALKEFLSPSLAKLMEDAKSEKNNG